MDIADILFNEADLFEQIDNTSSTESPMWNLVKISQALNRRPSMKSGESWSCCFREEDV